MATIVAMAPMSAMPKPTGGKAAPGGVVEIGLDREQEEGGQNGWGHLASPKKRYEREVGGGKTWREKRASRITPIRLTCHEGHPQKQLPHRVDNVWGVAAHTRGAGLEQRGSVLQANGNAIHPVLGIDLFGLPKDRVGHAFLLLEGRPPAHLHE